MIFQKHFFKGLCSSKYLFNYKPIYQFSSNHVEQQSPIISSKIKLDDISQQINNYDNLIEFYSNMINNQNQKQLKKFEIDYYNEVCAKQLQNFIQDDHQYQQFLVLMLQKKELNLNYLQELFKYCGKANLFPSNQKLIMSNILEKKQEEYQKLLKKIISYINLYLKIFVVGYLISFAYRAYYYFEYDISIYHPRATAWHVYRFR